MHWSDNYMYRNVAMDHDERVVRSWSAVKFGSHAYRSVGRDASARSTDSADRTTAESRVQRSGATVLCRHAGVFDLH